MSLWIDSRTPTEAYVTSRALSTSCARFLGSLQCFLFLYVTQLVTTVSCISYLSIDHFDVYSLQLNVLIVASISGNLS
jgi:hypothetical protein